MLSELELTQNPDAGERLAIQKGAANIIFRDMAPGTPGDIERLIKLHKPDFMIVDQIRNIRIKDADGGTAVLDQAAQFIRAMGKKYELITIGITQAGDSATGKLILSMSDIDGSKTGIPGAADVLVMGGMTEALDAAGQRMLTLCKNKVSAIHESWAVSIDKIHSKYVSL